MAGNDASVIERLRKPEYTGENRCTPCTIVNVGIAAVASALAWVVAARAIGEAAAGGLGVGLFAACLGIIYLWGYLIPGTPTLTKRYLPNRVLALFDKHPLDDQHSEEEPFDAVERKEAERRNAVDPEQFLLGANVVAPCEREDDLCLSDEFADRLEDHTERFRSSEPDAETFADLFDADPESVAVEDRDHPAVEIRNRVRKWPSDGALIADVAADRALRDQSDDWTAVPLEQRLKILESLRSFRQTCPLCSGGVELGTDTVESCCRSYEVATASCLDCGETLLEFDPSAIDAAAEKEAV
ncbi:hypothetical protein ACFQDG_08050 [Natronoarchaeum mannanilyticum]|uniref:Restriction endonuclease n=1 Tax=Natronoarchaeum mannanilyticum TaxID=926360 RepID=A0AAV3TDH3_9EURY